MSFADFTRLVDPPLYVVTVAVGPERSGCLVGFAGQVSIYPPRFLVCISELNHTAGLATRAEALAVHLLGADQQALAARFGGLTGDEEDKFAGIAWHRGPAGAPILDEARAVFEGDVLDAYRFGDHRGYLLEPLDASAGEPPNRQLRLHDAEGIEPGHPADEAAGRLQEGG